MRHMASARCSGDLIPGDIHVDRLRKTSTVVSISGNVTAMPGNLVVHDARQSFRMEAWIGFLYWQDITVLGTDIALGHPPNVATKAMAPDTASPCVYFPALITFPVLNRSDLPWRTVWNRW